MSAKRITAKKIVALLALVTMLLTATTAPTTAYAKTTPTAYGDYNVGDIAVINNIIDNNGLTWEKWTSGEMPISWEDHMRWSDTTTNKCVERLYINNSGLTGTLDLSGLTSLRVLWCWENRLTLLNASGLTSLELLYCQNSQLTTLNVNGLTNLKELDCSSNKLTTLNASGLSNLELLDCDNNQLTTLNVSGLTNLELLNCDSNKLADLNVNGLTNLTKLNCRGNKLTALNVSGLINIEELACLNNQLTELNVNEITNLRYLYCQDNQLTMLYVSELSNLESLVCYNNKLTSLILNGSAPYTYINAQNNKFVDTNMITGRTILWDTDSSAGTFVYSPQSVAQSHTDIAKAIITAIPDQTYTGKPITPNTTVKYNDKILTPGTDYDVSYANNTNIGKASVTITGKGAYTGTQTVYFNIIANNSNITTPTDIKKATITKIPDQIYTGRQITPKPAVKYSGKTLTPGTDYTVSYANNKNIGKATITITGKNAYTGTATAYFNIIPKAITGQKAKTAKGQIKFTWKKPQNATKIQLRYRQQNKKTWTTKTLSPKTTTLTVKNLKKAKRYEYQLRTYKTVNKTKYHSQWTKTKLTAKVK